MVTSLETVATGLSGASLALIAGLGYMFQRQRRNGGPDHDLLIKIAADVEHLKDGQDRVSTLITNHLSAHGGVL